MPKYGGIDGAFPEEQEGMSKRRRLAIYTVALVAVAGVAFMGHTAGFIPALTVNTAEQDYISADGKTVMCPVSAIGGSDTEFTDEFQLAAGDYFPLVCQPFNDDKVQIRNENEMLIGCSNTGKIGVAANPGNKLQDTGLQEGEPMYGGRCTDVDAPPKTVTMLGEFNGGWKSGDAGAEGAPEGTAPCEWKEKGSCCTLSCSEADQDPIDTEEDCRAYAAMFGSCSNLGGACSESGDSCDSHRDCAGEGETCACRAAGGAVGGVFIPSEERIVHLAGDGEGWMGDSQPNAYAKCMQRRSDHAIFWDPFGTSDPEERNTLPGFDLTDGGNGLPVQFHEVCQFVQPGLDDSKALWETECGQCAVEGTCTCSAGLCRKNGTAEGGLCPPSHPFAFNKNSIRGGGCCNGPLNYSRGNHEWMCDDMALMTSQGMKPGKYSAIKCPRPPCSGCERGTGSIREIPYPSDEL